MLYELNLGAALFLSVEAMLDYGLAKARDDIATFEAQYDIALAGTRPAGHHGIAREITDASVLSSRTAIMSNKPGPIACACAAPLPSSIVASCLVSMSSTVSTGPKRGPCVGAAGTCNLPVCIAP
ncbi:hypothetical protein CTP10_R25220 [Cupriavidus sp. P-10]|uniref:hypothetical protein n=1 Tax=Cupriavidus sp. P-10 TaxID=2027911 RepID=UPI0011C1AAC9|nr:hypothetical protein [Cupriavidus sp. P-10]BDB25148.1 hypothetical protein CTP10_R25220 [Cupriavidus sp. P-10]